MNNQNIDTNNMTEDQLLEVENQYWADMAEALKNLKNNKDFQTLILNGYFRDKAVNGVSLLAQDSIVSEGRRPSIIESLVAISHLEDYFIMVENLGTPHLDEEEE